MTADKLLRLLTRPATYVWVLAGFLIAVVILAMR